MEGSAVLPELQWAVLVLFVQWPEQSLAILFSVPRFGMETLCDPIEARVLKETEKEQNKEQVQSDELLVHAGGNKCW